MLAIYIYIYIYIFNEFVCLFEASPYIMYHDCNDSVNVDMLDNDVPFVD